MQTSTVVTTPDIVGAQRKGFLDNGYLVFENVIDPKQLADLAGSIRAEFERVKSGGQLFVGGGTVSGHLNCFPGAASRFVQDQLRSAGIVELVRSLSVVPLRAPNIGCNLNLPGSHAQNEHVDGYASQPFLVVNVACVDTDLENGAMEILCGTHRRDSKYWRILLDQPERLRLQMKQGDIVVRTSTLWHRGMPNHTERARPMLAFTWEDGGSRLEDPYAVHDGKITFLPNRYQTDWASRLRERAFVAMPAAGVAFRAVRSLF
jgi:ectoine hydroxylase-related dioxygenase (phytanoyl-CoA dioxygenase family)